MKCFLFPSRLLLIILNLNQNASTNLLHIKTLSWLSLRCLLVMQSSHASEDCLRHLTWLLLPGDQLQGLLLYLILLHLLLHSPLLRLGLLRLTDCLWDVGLIMSISILPQCLSLKRKESW